MKNVTALTYLSMASLGLLLGVFLSGCALDGGANSGTSGTCEASADGVKAFVSSGFHGDLQANCAACHTMANSKAPSSFADPTDTVAYPYGKRWVDFSN